MTLPDTVIFLMIMFLAVILISHEERLRKLEKDLPKESKP